MTVDGVSSQTQTMFLLDFLKLQYRIAKALPAGNYAYLHMFDQVANGRASNGLLQIPSGPFPNQIAALAHTLDLETVCIDGASIGDLGVNTYLTPIFENERDFRKEIMQLANIGEFSEVGFITNRYFDGYTWTYRDTSVCDSWLIELNDDHPELSKMAANT